MYRTNESASSIRKAVEFDLENLTDDSDDESHERSTKYNLHSGWTAVSPRRFRKYAIIVIVVVFVIWLTGHRSYQPPGLSPHLRYESIDWSQYAYSQYVTDSSYLCNAVMVFEALDRLGSRAQRILYYPESWDTTVENRKDRDSQLLNLARDKYKVQLVPVPLQYIDRHPKEGIESRDYSISKFYAFRETQFRRILHLDSDVIIRQNLDELFFLPSAPVAMPRAYQDWPRSHKLANFLILIEPAYREWRALMDAAEPAQHGQMADDGGRDTYDVQLLNDRYGNSALVLPHRQYGLVTGEFRTKDHRLFLGNDYEQWNPDKALNEAKVIHFSDWPLPKPWIMWPQGQLANMLPKCDKDPGTPKESGCRDRDVWLGLYDDFRQRRKDICKLLSYPAPDWPPRDGKEGFGMPPASP